MYCRTCGYQLAGLSAYRCPECGRPFDPANGRTFLRRPKGWLVRRLIRRMLVALACLAVAIGAAMAWLYYDWKRCNAPGLGFVAASVRLDKKTIGPAWLKYLLGRRLGYLLDRPESVTFGQVGDDDLARAGMLLSLEQVFVVGDQTQPSHVTEAGLAHLRDLKSLRTLGLQNTPISDAAMAPISQLRSLESLGFTHAQLTDSGLAQLGGLKRLRRLSLYLCSGYTGAGLSFLKDLPQLESLVLYGQEITDQAAVNIAEAKNVRTLDLRDTAITDEGLRHLAGLTKVEVLYVLPVSGDIKDGQIVRSTEPRISDAGLQYIGQMTELRGLILSSTRVTAHGMKHLAGLKHLEALDLSWTDVSGGGMENLKDLVQLRYLGLGYTRITNAAAEPLAALPNLVELDVRSTRMTEEGVAQLTKAMPKTKIDWP
jgi:Leucine-rich repeat (LRR) protein